ncbi:MAG: hypothetical protein AAB589_00405 [Patescibacteria group bacterium]
MKKFLLSLGFSLITLIPSAQAQSAPNNNFVDLLWEARTYTPTGYRGKALPSSQSEVKVVALAQIANLAPENLIYTWQKDGYNLPANSGTGKNSLIYRAGNTGSNAITVEVKTPTGETRLKQTLNLSLVSPKALIYPTEPLLGPNYALAIPDTWHLPENTFSLIAEPYFFSLANLASGQVAFSWLINNQLATPSSEDGRTVILQNRSGKEGVAPVNLRIKNKAISNQEAARDLQIEFGNDGFSFWPKLLPVALAQEVGGVNVLEPGVIGATGSTPIANLPDYLKALFKQAVGLLGLFAIITIVWKGVQYTINPLPGVKTDAKDRLWEILKGIILALAAYLILQQINPNLVNLNFILPK